MEGGVTVGELHLQDPPRQRRSHFAPPTPPPLATMDATAKAHAGIQKLLQAEQDAAEIVAKAKQDKVARLKQAKAEADEEIAAYKVRMSRSSWERACE